jgi:hypothetical protein
MMENRSMIGYQSALSQTKKKFGVLLLGLLLVLPGLARADVNFKFTTIDVPQSTGTTANGNSPNAIAGQFDDSGGNTHGFVLRADAYTTINKPGAFFTAVNGINAIGQLTGTYQDASGFHAYFWSKASSPHSTRPDRSDRKADSSTRKAKLSEPTGVVTINVMGSFGTTASLTLSTCPVTTRSVGRSPLG